MRPYTALSSLAAAAMAVLAAGCSGPGCSTSTDPATCANTEGVNNYNRARQLNQAPPGPQYPDQYQMMDRAGRGETANPAYPGYSTYPR